jgi:hypothetical protein
MSERCLFAIALHSILLADEYTFQAISLPYGLLFLLRTDELIIHFELWMLSSKSDRQYTSTITPKREEDRHILQSRVPSRDLHSQHPIA